MRLDQVFILAELLQECSRAISARLEVVYKLLKSIKFQHKLVVIGSVLEQKGVVQEQGQKYMIISEQVICGESC